MFDILWLVVSVSALKCFCNGRSELFVICASSCSPLALEVTNKTLRRTRCVNYRCSVCFFVTVHTHTDVSLKCLQSSEIKTFITSQLQ